MKEIIDTRIQKKGLKFVAKCSCGAACEFASKNSALLMLNRGSCTHCKKDYRTSEVDKTSGIFKNNNGKWCSKCPSCEKEQEYTRKEHARNSSVLRTHCRQCAVDLSKFSRSNSVGDKTRLFNKFKKSAEARKLVWDLTEETMFFNYTGFCALTGWELSIEYKKCTASLDRIDSTKGYFAGNIQWVHSTVNMAKNKTKQEDFVTMCKAIADKATDRVKW